MVFISCNANNPVNNADNPTNAAPARDNTGPDSGRTTMSDYGRSTVTTDTVPGATDSGGMGVMPVK